ncbi:MAG: CHAT domain-containing protein [Synechococcales bacterium]|nr:CHAT domain-containing protein [Synechococcales bacterium]
MLRISRLLVLGLVGMITVLSVPAVGIQVGLYQSNRWLASYFTSAEVAAAAVPTAAVTPEALFQRGLDLYEAGSFFDAVETWKASAQLFEKQPSPLNRALALGYVSLGYQKLGQLDKASAYLSESLHILENSEPSQDAAGDAEIAAKLLNIEGTFHWNRGQIDQALASWQEAEQFYQRVGQLKGVAIAQINQAKALQALGYSRQSATLLRQTQEILKTQPDRALQATGLRNLGVVLRQLGDLETSRTLLQDSLSLASDDEAVRLIRLELGNTERVWGDRLQTVGRVPEAQQHLRAAQRYYRQAIDENGGNDAPLEAYLNLLNLLIATRQSDAAINLLADVPARFELLPLSRRRIYFTINFTEQWLKLATQLQLTYLSGLSYLDVAQRLARAAQEAQALSDRQAKSSALGQLGRLYERIGQNADAKRLTQEARLQLEGLNVPEIQYRWEWQLGRIADQSGDRSLALNHYEAAIATLQTVRSNLLSIDPDVQFSFRDDVEPVYRELVELLLVAEDTRQPEQQQLEKAIRLVDQLQLAELENYLGCQVATVGQVRTVQDQTAAVIYPIVLSDRLAIVTRFPGQTELSYHETAVAKDEVETVLQALRLDLAVPGRTPEVIEGSEKLYNWLIRPLEAELQRSETRTLVFVPDGALRNVPMAALFDGEQYLIQKGYAVAIAPRLELFLPGETPAQLRVKLGGVGVPQEIEMVAFPTIAKLEEELGRIAQIVEATPPLLNESFTVENIKRQLQQDPVSAIHWKTHGVFSSDPSQTYIVGFNERISSATLNELIAAGSQGGNQPLELLVLSACETAQGDNRAVLGLAGLAARTGTRSVVSALWVALDTPNTEFMVRFYELLAQKDKTKAEALRQAQLALIDEYGYTTPYIWANYILIGNWL